MPRKCAVRASPIRQAFPGQARGPASKHGQGLITGAGSDLLLYAYRCTCTFYGRTAVRLDEAR